ncbi:hypothetical protein ED21_19122 [Erythrobacter sp. SD-21]|nr:hypothetical protein ED21_19122 [Erythrobacter sp. SD-21]
MNFRDNDWIALVKATREKFGVSIQDAHDLIFSDEEMRRLVTRINQNLRCRTMASKDIAQNGKASRFVRDGERIKFRRIDGQRD